ncbi:KpsF/GutQ family sugar-phosphate isomerase [Acutalibacter intestini]|uniref:KpsF/GutQ family sugar-phosphate isomerase n=1 Tax=Acutalibacter intestini TaxID=3093659 RepID=UPI002AC9B58A|nr:SIS domain-containing protein [Acutalibacter sp. M00204]
MTDQELLEQVQHSIETEAQSIRGLAEKIQGPEWLALIHLLAETKGRIVLSGCGTSAMAAQKISHSLNCVARPSFFLVPSDAVHGGLGAVRPGDVCVLVSKGGNTAELVRLLPALKAKGARVVAVTENRGSALAQAADLVLNVAVDREPDPFNMLATASTVSVIAAFDAVCVALMWETGYTREQFAVIHPGGAVGERLTGGKEGG